MTGQADYYTQTEAEDAMSVVAGWIGQNRNIKVQFHSGTAVDADIKTGRLRIPRLACASGITQEALMLLRSRVYHEAGHIDETDVEKPQGALGEILNALEDRRMEASEARKHKGCEVAFRWATNWYNKDIAGQAVAGKINAPLWEALCGMAFMSEGVQPAWTLSDKAQVYVDASYSEFAKVSLCKNTTDCLNLAKRILALLKDANEQYKKENPNPPKQQQQKQQPQQKQDGEEQEGEPQSGGQGDLDEEGDDQQKSKSGKSKKDDNDSEDGEDGSEDGEGESDGEDGSEDGDDSEDGKDGSGSSDGDGEKTDGDSDDESTGGSGSDNESDNDNESDSESDNDGGEKLDGPDADSEYKPNTNRQEDGGSEEESDEWKATNLEDELQGRSKEDAIGEAIEEFFDDLDPADSDYLSRRDMDEHRIPKSMDSDKQTFKEERKKIAVMAASMTRALEQALRSLCRCKRQGYMRQGRIDHKRLVSISRGLSREVFFKIKDGQNLEVAVEIIIDESGSMGNYRQVRLLAIAIGEALDAIGVPFEITGTTTKYGWGQAPSLDGMTRTNPIKYNHYVMFGEKWQAVSHRLVHTGAHCHNIDGEAVEYCAFRLQQRPERRKVVFSLSDGEPCGGQGTDYDLGRNIKTVCKKARKNGVEVYGFGIGTKAPLAFYGKDFFVYLDDVVTMSQMFLRKFTEVITGGQVKM